MIRSVIVEGPDLVALGREEFYVDGAGPRPYSAPILVSSDLSVNAAVWTSVDGLTWIQVPDNGTLFRGAEDQDIGLTFDGPDLLVVGSDPGGLSADRDAAGWVAVPEE